MVGRPLERFCHLFSAKLLVRPYLGFKAVVALSCCEVHLQSADVWTVAVYWSLSQASRSPIFGELHRTGKA